MDFEVPTFRTLYFGRDFEVPTSGKTSLFWVDTQTAKQHPRIIRADVPDEHQAGAETSDSLEGSGSDSTEATQTSTGWLGDPGPANMAAEISQKYPLMSSIFL